MSEYDRPAKMRHQSRSATVAGHCIVPVSVPLPSQVGLDILKAGGTKADAAIATDAMLGLTEPMSCWMGGDLFCIYWGQQNAEASRPQRGVPGAPCLQSRSLREEGDEIHPG